MSWIKTQISKLPGRSTNSNACSMIIHKLCLESQEPFDGCFSANCLTAPVNKNMRIFFNTVLQGQATVNGKKNINDNTNQDARDKIACIVSQLLMYNVTKGVHHTVRTDTVRHSKERETPFPLYYGLKLHALGRQKNQIGIAQEQGICVSYSRVMEVKLDIARAVCARHAEDGCVVVPTNCRMNVFTTHDVDNLDGRAKGNYSMDEFRGYALSVTNHLSHDNLGQKRAPIKLDPTDKSTLKLPDSYMIQPSVELNQNDIFAPRCATGKVRPQADVHMHNAEVKDEAWMSHVSTILKQDSLGTNDIITWSGYNSMLASSESVKPPAEIGVYPLFPHKASSPSSMKHAMHLTMQGTQFLNPGQTSVLGADQPMAISR